MDYSTKLVYQSNYWYNDGLKRAGIRDLSGAITSLRKSLQYNRENIAARNLLGLVYYGRGDVGEALVEWILSKNFQSYENIANYYIQKLQENSEELDALNQAAKRYNQALGYARQNGEDLAIIQLKKAVAAHPNFVKAHQLLTLLYLQTDQYSKARQSIRAAHKLDTTDDITLRYMHELNKVRRSKTAKVKEKKKARREEEQTVTYTIGNETIIQPVSSAYKEHVGLHTVINIGIGVLVGVAVMWFLIMPAISASRQGKVNQQTVGFSDQIATQKSQISALKKELEGFRSNSVATEDAQATAASTQESYEVVLNIYDHYRNEDMSDLAMADELLKVNPGSLGTIGRTTYDEITGGVYPRLCEDLYGTSQQNYEAANYPAAIENLEKVIQMDAGYSDGNARLLLAQSYEGSGNQEQADLGYQFVVENYPGTEAANAAQQALAAKDGAAAPEDGAAAPEDDADTGEDTE